MPISLKRRKFRSANLKVAKVMLKIYFWIAAAGALLWATDVLGLAGLGKGMVLIPGIWLLIFLPIILFCPEKTVASTPEPVIQKMSPEEELEYLTGILQANPMIAEKSGIVVFTNRFHRKPFRSGLN